MATEDVRNRLASTVKQIADISGTATKVGVIGIAALTVLWLTQIRPAYDKLLKDTYPELTQSLSDERDQSLALISGRPDASGALVLRESISRQAPRRDKLIEQVNFEVLGLKVPVRPLYAPLMWSVVLLSLLIYMAQARRAVWTLLSTAVGHLKSLSTTDLDEAVGSGPLWLAPPPRPPVLPGGVTAAELLAAFGWRRLETLPNVVATAGFLVLVLVQIDLVDLSFAVLQRAMKFADTVKRLSEGHLPRGFAKSLADVGDVVIRPGAAATVSLLLVLLLTSTVWVAVCWFRPWDVPARRTERKALYQLMARAVVLAAVIAITSFAAGTLWPESTLGAVALVAQFLGVIDKMLVGAVIVLGTAEILKLAMPNQLALGATTGEASAGQAAVPNEIGQPVLARRHMILSGLGVAAGLLWSAASGSLGSFRLEMRRKVRRRRPRVAWKQKTTLPEGFYVRAGPPDAKARRHRRAVAYYVDRWQRLSYVPSRIFSRDGAFEPTLNSSALVGVATSGITATPYRDMPNAPGKSTPNSIPQRRSGQRPKVAQPSELIRPRVDLFVASVAFEMAALELVTRQKPQYAQACAVLLNGIEHDAIYKRRVRGAPSLRLYDLYARLAVRHGLEHHIDMLPALGKKALELVDLQKSGSPTRRSRKKKGPPPGSDAVAARARRRHAVEQRMARWSDPRSEWRQRTTDRSKLLTWTISRSTTRDRVLSGEGPRLDDIRVTFALDPGIPIAENPQRARASV